MYVVCVCVCFTLLHLLFIITFIYFIIFQCFLCISYPIFNVLLLYTYYFFLFSYLSLSITSYSQALAEIDLSLSCAISLLCYSLHLPAYLSLSLLFHLSGYSLLQCCRLHWVPGYEVSSYLRQPAVGFQRFPHLGHRCIYMASTLCSPGQAGQNQRLVPSQQQPHWVASGD